MCARGIVTERQDMEIGLLGVLGDAQEAAALQTGGDRVLACANPAAMSIKDVCMARVSVLHPTRDR